MSYLIKDTVNMSIFLMIIANPMIFVMKFFHNFLRFCK